MNKKAFIGATLVTATVVGTAVYFRHKILEQVDKWLDDGNEPTRVWREAQDLTAEEVAEFEAALKDRQ
jgi:hypothetical protein